MLYFISHSSLDFAKAKLIANAILSNKSARVWIAPDSVPAGMDSFSEIAKAIEKCDVFVLVFSNNAQQSDYVAEEFSLAKSEKKLIYPLFIENIKPENSYKLKLSNIHRINMYDNFEKSLEDFINTYINKLDKYKKIKSVHELAKEHLTKMGYKIIASNTKLTDFSENIFIAKGKRQYTVIPIYTKDRRISYIKQLEGELFWKYRDLIWNQNFTGYINKILGFDKKIFNNENIDYKDKVKILDAFRNIKSNTEKMNYTTSESILFYLYWDNPPKFKNISTILPFESVETYQNGEQLPNVFLNLAFKPNWWGVGKNNFDSIPGNPYPNIVDNYECLLPLLSIDR